jgi:hypothetical protein
MELLSMCKSAVTLFVLIALSVDASAQQLTEVAPAALVERVLNANPEPDGKAYRIDFLLKNGQQVSYEIPPPEVIKITDGLSKPAVAGGHSKQVAALVYGMSIEVDAKGLAIILRPSGSAAPLEPLAIPMTGADQFLSVLQSKIAEAKAIQQQNRP